MTVDETYRAISYVLKDKNVDIQTMNRIRAWLGQLYEDGMEQGKYEQSNHAHK